MLGEESEEQYLQRIAVLTGADEVRLTRWLKVATATEKTTSTRDDLETEAHMRDWLEETLRQQTPALPCLLESLLQDSVAGARALDSHRNMLSVLLDTEPTRMIMTLFRHDTSAHWSDREKAAFLEYANVMRHSVRLHKVHDNLRYIVDISNAVFNSSPRGLIGLLTDGGLLIANKTAMDMVRRNDGISINGANLVLKDKALQAELFDLVGNLGSMTPAELSGFSWHRALNRDNELRAYQLSLRIISLPDWHMESSPSDKLALLIISDPSVVPEPALEQLEQYFGLTRAQARLAQALWGGTGIQEAADLLAISVNTARSHLRAIYGKIGVNNHAEMVAVLSHVTTGYSDSSQFSGHYQPSHFRLFG